MASLPQCVLSVCPSRLKKKKQCSEKTRVTFKIQQLFRGAQSLNNSLQQEEPKGTNCTEAGKIEKTGNLLDVTLAWVDDKISKAHRVSLSQKN